MVDDREPTLNDAITRAGHARRRRSTDASLGDEQTLGDSRSEQETVVDEIEVVDLEVRYKVEGTLGQGGMGAVLLATDTRLDRKVAIKRILGEAAGNGVAVQRFLTEAKSIAALNHPNVVQIHDYGRTKDGPFLIMEYVDGGSLLDRCRANALPLDEAIDLACQLCDGLAKAHDLGIVHRDIKPGNVLLTKDGIPKLTDFGLAKAQASDHGQTMTGAVLGTPDFMPPEQRRDASLVDHRSDLWSLAATIYQMATGRSPKVIRLHELPQALRAVMARALEDAKEERYQSARDLRDALKTAHRSDLRAAPVVADSEGQCPSCSVQNDPKRKFCRGCGGSLEAPCLGCGEPMPMWEEICGACGKKQAPLVEEQQTAEAARQTEAEGLLGDCEFDRAVAAATTLRRDPHPRLRDLTVWMDAFLHQVEHVRREQVARAVDAIREAEAHDAAHDCLSAISALESVPSSLRRVVLPDTKESVATALRRLKQKQAEIKWLEGVLKRRIKEQSLDGLLSEAEKLLALQPHREDVQKIRAQLLGRQAKLAAARDEAIKQAAALMESHDYEGALATLDTIAPAFVTREVVILREKAGSSIREAKRLKESIRLSVASQQLEGLVGKLDAYLRLKPLDAEFGRLRKSLVEKAAKAAARLASRFTSASQLAQSCNFLEAALEVRAIPEDRQSDAVIRVRSILEQALFRRVEALLAINTANARGEHYKKSRFGKGAKYQRFTAAARNALRLTNEYESFMTNFPDAWMEVGIRAGFCNGKGRAAFRPKDDEYFVAVGNLHTLDSGLRGLEIYRTAKGKKLSEEQFLKVFLFFLAVVFFTFVKVLLEARR